MSTHPDICFANQSMRANIAPRRPAVIHLVMEELAAYDVHPALCGFVITPANMVSMPTAAAEGSERCGKCEAVSLRLQFEES